MMYQISRNLKAVSHPACSGITRLFTLKQLQEKEKTKLLLQHILLGSKISIKQTKHEYFITITKKWK
jgi:hypothetical protein